MLRMVTPTLDPIHEFHVLLNQTGLMRWAQISHSYLAMTKESVYSDERQPLAPREGSERKYLIVYPMWKKREWYGLPGEERMRIMRGHIETGAPLRDDRDQHGLLVRPRRPGVRRVVQHRRPGRLPRPGAGAALDRVERLHGVGDADLHLHHRLGRAGAGALDGEAVVAQPA